MFVTNEVYNFPDFCNFYLIMVSICSMPATANTETRFVEDAVQQLLKARRMLKCSYVYGFYLDGPGYKKIVFEFMQVGVKLLL